MLFWAWKRKLVFIMRLTFSICLLSVLQSFAISTFSQNSKLSINQENISVENVIQLIEDQTEYYFMYSGLVVDVKRTVDLNIKKKSVPEILEVVFKNTDVTYKINGRLIALNTVGKNSSVVFQKQNVTISGRVSDSSGSPLPGVTVAVKGTTQGTVTSADGEYSIRDIPEDAILQFSFVGMKTQEISIAGKTNINIIMEEDAIGIEEVVAIGYGTRKKGELTGSLASVNTDVFQNRPVLNTYDALQGRLSGVVIQKGSGAPGDNDYDIKIRGYSSINGNSPLVLIDGSPGSINTINTDDIESVVVLKDAAAAIYGARAGDGVILVTTKSPKKGEPTITYTSNVNIKSPKFRETLNTMEYATLMSEAQVNMGEDPIPESVFEKIRNKASVDASIPHWGYNLAGYDVPALYTDVDRAGAIIQNAVQHRHTLSISGGGDKSCYGLSLGYNNDQGIFKYGNQKAEQYNARLKYDIQFSEKLKLNVIASMDRTTSSGPKEAENMLTWYQLTHPWAPLYTPRGNYYSYLGGYNVIQNLVEGGNYEDTKAWYTGNAKIDYKIIEGLTISGQAIAQVYNRDKHSNTPTYYNYNWDDEIYITRNNLNSAEYVYGKSFNLQLFGFLNYKKSFSDDHRIGVMLGASNEQYSSQGIDVNAKNFLRNNQFSLNLADITNLSYINVDGFSSGYGLVSFFGNFNYIYKDKLFLDIITRLDGSSKFAESERWSQIFPSVALAYDFAQEDFIKSSNIFNQLKIRASWGKTGNQEINEFGLYDYIPLVKIKDSGYPLGTNGVEATSAYENVASASRTWETIENKNIGVDFKTLASRLSFTGDIFVKKNSDMLVEAEVPSTYGATPPTQNLGTLKTKGFELSLGWNDKINKNLRYGIRFQLSNNTNKLIELKNSSGSAQEGLNQILEGYSINSYFGYESQGLINTQEQLNEYKKLSNIPSRIDFGDIMFKDIDGDGAITALGDKEKGYSGDMKYLGNINPRYTYSADFSIGYKRFNMEVFLQGVGKRDVMWEGLGTMPILWYYTPYKYYYGKTWTPDRTTDVKFPRQFIYGGAGWDDMVKWNYLHTSDNRIESGAYLRVKLITLSYEIPASVCSMLKIKQASVYVSGQDLFTYAPGSWNGTYDPEDGTRGLSTYPFNKTYSMGLNITF